MTKPQQYPTTDEAKKLLEKYIPRDKKRNGLFLLPLQTGSGKTHATAQYIAQEIKDNTKYTMFYIVHTIKNVEEAYDKLTSLLTEEEKKKTLLLKSYTDRAIDFFTDKEFDDSEFEYLTKIKEYIDLRDYAKYITNDNKSTPMVQKNLSSYDSNLRKKLRNFFQKGELSSSKEKINLNKFKDEAFFLYPTVKIEKFKAIYTTTHKFYYPIFKLEETSKFYTNSAFKNALLFIDEFDAQKKIILDLIIDSYKAYNPIELFRLVKYSLEKREFTRRFKLDENSVNAVTQYFDEIYEKYNMKYTFQYEFKEQENYETILIDSTISYAIKANGYNLGMTMDEDKEINFVDESKEVKFLKMIQEIQSGLNRIVGLGKKAINTEISYLQSKSNENREDIAERVANDFIKEFGFLATDVHYYYLMERIRDNTFERAKLFKQKKDEFYEDGFKLIDASQISQSSSTTDFSFFELRNTPEKILKDICKHMFVVGISATGTIKSLIKNFDLEYVTNNIPSPTISRDETKSMEDLYLKSKNQENRVISINSICSCSVEAAMEEYFDDGYENFSVKEHLEALYNKSNTYYFCQYIRLVHVYRDFLLHDEIDAFMYLQTNYPREGFFKPAQNKVFINDMIFLIYEMMKANQEAFNEKIQEEIEKLIDLEKEYNNIEKFIQELRNTNRLLFLYNSKKENHNEYENFLKEKNQRNLKMFLISSYVAMGTGRNMEYADESDLIKDFDGIYLDEPTNLITRNFKHEGSEGVNSKKLKALFELESMLQNGYYSNEDYKMYSQWILAANSKKMNYIPYKDTTDYVNSIMIVLIQAIGRLYRTPNDDTKMFIYYNSVLSKIINDFDDCGQSLLPAAHELLKHAQEECHHTKTNRDDENVIRAKNMCQKQNSILYRNIQYILQIIFSGKEIRQDVIDEWTGHRDFLLRNPTVMENLSKFNNSYFKLPSKYSSKKVYHYNAIDDYKIVNISFEEDGMEVSKEAAKLDILKNIPELDECIKDNGIELEFKHDYMMSPVAFNNLYKGALGDVVGKFLVEKYCGIELEMFSPNEDKSFERFDYKTADNRLYFDFKYYDQSTITSVKQIDIKKNAREKLAQMSGERAIIINIFADIEEGKSDKLNLKDSDVVIIPFLIDITDRSRPIVNLNMFSEIRKFYERN